MKSVHALALIFCVAAAAGEPTPVPAKPALKITPGQVIVPTDKMKRIWGELVSIDQNARTGTFRNESNDTLMPFTVLPYAELLHHAAFGDLQDFRIGERAIFRLHENEAGEWVWLTYIQDEMNFLNNHKEYYYVDSLDADKKSLSCTDANFDMSFVREKGISIETDAETRFWKNGEPAKFSDIKTGDKLRTKTHGTGKGKVRMCWEVFLDDASFTKFQTEQKAVHLKRMADEGVPGYVDSSAAKEIALTLFQESGELARKWKAGEKIRVAPAGVDRKPSAAPVSGSIAAIKPAGNLTKITLTLDEEAKAFRAGELARIWAAP
jgi:hypothetical protein